MRDASRISFCCGGVGVAGREGAASQVRSASALRVNAMARRAVQAEVSFADINGGLVSGQWIALCR